MQSWDVFRWRQLETRTWLSADCLSPTLDDTLLRSAVWLPIQASKQNMPVLAVPSERSAVWLLIFEIKCHASQFVIVLMKLSNYASEYTRDLVPQASDRLLSILCVLDGVPGISWWCFRHARISTAFAYGRLMRSVIYFVSAVAGFLNKYILIVKGNLHYWITDRYWDIQVL